MSIGRCLRRGSLVARCLSCRAADSHGVAQRTSQPAAVESRWSGVRARSPSGQVGLGLGPLCGVFRDGFESGSVGNAGTCRPKRPCRVQKPLSPAYCPIRCPDAPKRSPMLPCVLQPSTSETRPDRLPHPQNVGSALCEPTCRCIWSRICGQGFRGHTAVQHSSGLGAIGAIDRSWRACEVAKHPSLDIVAAGCR